MHTECTTYHKRYSCLGGEDGVGALECCSSQEESQVGEEVYSPPSPAGSGTEGRY